jgi:integral membrane sensor domain MASE1
LVCAARLCKRSFKAALSAYALQRFTSGRVRLNTLRQLAIFIGVAVVTVPALSAVIGGVARNAAGYEFWSSFYDWFLGDASAALIITPTLLYWCLKGWREMDAHVTELAILVVGFCCISVFHLPAASLRLLSHYLVRSRAVSNLGRQSAWADWHFDRKFGARTCVNDLSG